MHLGCKMLGVLCPFFVLQGLRGEKNGKVYTRWNIYIYICIYTLHTPDKDYKYSLRTIPKTIHHTIHSMKPFINLIRNMNFMLLKCKTWNNQQESHQVQYQNNPTVRNTKESKPSSNKKKIRSITSCRF